MVLPSIFGSRQANPGAAGNAAAGGPEAAGEEKESRKQAKLRARMEKGDKRVQQVQGRR